MSDCLVSHNNQAAYEGQLPIQYSKFLCSFTPYQTMIDMATWNAIASILSPHASNTLDKSVDTLNKGIPISNIASIPPCPNPNANAS